MWLRARQLYAAFSRCSIRLVFSCYFPALPLTRVLSVSPLLLRRIKLSSPQGRQRRFLARALALVCDVKTIVRNAPLGACCALDFCERKRDQFGLGHWNSPIVSRTGARRPSIVVETFHARGESKNHFHFRRSRQKEVPLAPRFSCARLPTSFF